MSSCVYDLAVGMGGDVFVANLSRVENDDNCRPLADRIRSITMQDIPNNEEMLRNDVRIGYANFPELGLRQDEWFEATGKAMLQWKRDKRRKLDAGAIASPGPEQA